MVSFSILQPALIERLYDPQRTRDGCRMFTQSSADVDGGAGGRGTSEEQCPQRAALGGPGPERPPNPPLSLQASSPVSQGMVSCS